MKVRIYKDKGVSQDTSFLSNEQENEVAKIEIKLPGEFIKETYFYYIACRPPDETKSLLFVPLTLNDNTLIYTINSNVTSAPGDWQFCIVVKSIAIVDNVIGVNGFIAISDCFIGKVVSGILEKEGEI